MDSGSKFSGADISLSYSPARQDQRYCHHPEGTNKPRRGEGAEMNK